MNWYGPNIPLKLLLLSLTLMLVIPSISTGADVEFRWAVLAGSKAEGMEPLDFTGSPIVFSGTDLQIYVEHLNNCYIYLFLLDSGSELTPLYPSEKGYYDYGFPRGPKFIPPGDNTFSFVPPAGLERIYLIGSEVRLFQIEKLTEIYNESSTNAQRDLLLSEIKTILDEYESASLKGEKRRKAQRKSRTAEGIVSTSFYATEVAVSERYGRVITIDHR